MAAEPTVIISSEDFDAVVFDMDGVVTKTAKVHAAAWKELFDAYLRVLSERDGTPYRPFDIEADYLTFVDGKPRYDGVRDFLASRGIELPPGAPSDLPEMETVCGLGNRKNAFFVEQVEENGVEAFESTVTLVGALHDRGIRTAVISASENATTILEAADVCHLFEVQVDGQAASELGLPGKPDPAVFVEAVRRLGVDVSRAVVVEDAEAGVEAGRAGGFGLVIGVNRADHAMALLEHGATAVVDDLAEVAVAPALS